MPIHRNLTGQDDLLRPDRHGRCPGLLALDVSKRAIGLASADPTWTLVTPIGAIRRTRLRTDLAALERAIAERDAALLVLGWPLSMDGTEGPRCQAVMAFARDLDRANGLPIILQDERLTTFAAGEASAERTSRRAGPKTDLDALAAAQILEDFLAAVRRR